MKFILIPIRVFETGDKVITKYGLPATVVHDEMEGFDKEFASALSCSLESGSIKRVEANAKFRTGITLNMGDHEIITDRDSIELKGD